MKSSDTLSKYRTVALRAAILLSGLVLIMMLAAIADFGGMHQKVKDIQAFLGGFAVLAASLFSFHAGTAATAETYRKNERDHQLLVENTLLNVGFVAEALRQQSHARLCDLKVQTSDFQVDNVSSQFHIGLSIMLPEQAKGIWTNITFVDQEAQLLYLNLVNMVSVAEHERTHAEATRTFQRAAYTDLISTAEKLLELHKQVGFEAAEQQQQQLQLQLQLAQWRTSSLEVSNIRWSRLAGVLSNINHTAIELLKRLPEFKEWNADVAPYPPNFQPNPYTKPGTQILYKAFRV